MVAVFIIITILLCPALFVCVCVCIFYNNEKHKTRLNIASKFNLSDAITSCIAPTVLIELFVYILWILFIYWNIDCRVHTANLHDPNGIRLYTIILQKKKKQNIMKPDNKVMCTLTVIIFSLWERRLFIFWILSFVFFLLLIRH